MPNLMNFSDYIIFVDESGDHGLDTIHQNYPVFVLAFCIFKKCDYIQKIVPKLQELKFKYWGHDDIILHERDIRKSRGDGYEILNDEEVRHAFFSDLNRVIAESDFVITSTVVRKDKLKNYPEPSNPYELSLLFCMERLLKWLEDRGEAGKAVHIIFESRGRVEDGELELEFRRICDGISTLPLSSKSDFSKFQFSLRFVSKKANSLGLQLADLVARPIGLSVLKPLQKNQAFEIIFHKLMKYPNGEYDGKGIKVFPK